MKLLLHNRLDGVTKLGPGVRYGLWVQGCKRRCPGCMTPQSQPLDGGWSEDVAKLAEEIVACRREGITISGGEPFLQGAALAMLIDLVRQKQDLGVIVYTGYTLEELMTLKDEGVIALLQRCDLLVDGAYIQELNDGKNLRGSANQRAIALSDRYTDHVGEYGSRPAQAEIFQTAEKSCIVGIPSPGMLEWFKRMF